AGMTVVATLALAPATTASDLYACGVVLYQMLTGSHPFAADDQRQLMFRAISEEPRSITERHPDVPAALDAAVLEALAKKPELRPRSAEAFAEKLRKTLTRSEADVFATLRERLRRDFSGDMPALLKLEPLHVREKAWREEQRSAQIEPAPLSSSISPEPLPAPAALVHSQPTARPPRARRAAPQPPPERDADEAEPTATSEVGAAPARAPKLPMLRGIGLGAALMALTAGVLVLVLLLLTQQRAPASSAGRFIVVESPDKAGKAAAPIAAATAAEPTPDGAEPSPTPSGAQRPAPLPVSQPARESVGTSLSRQLARRRPALESCFKRFAEELQGRPEISVNFEVAASGRVSSATLSPEAMNGTPLGQCLLSVARATEFGPQSHAVRFSIPLVAHAVRE
ncbi:MAG TPA: hypothetical protein VNN80_36225, partial [Polyangiaceae bacterium]|nr:hypothetical protein [Polyangiaceae bacterium]